MNHLSHDDLSALLDGEQHEGRDHLAGCAACRRELEEIRGLEELLGRGRDVQADPPPVEQTVAAVRRRSVPKLRIVRPLAAAAAAALFALALGVMREPSAMDLVRRYAV